tara:strand:- start:1535 stop:1681 length:147 start_codon:yes stop_codon:yes gene_type:complete
MESIETLCNDIVLAIQDRQYDKAISLTNVIKSLPYVVDEDALVELGRS